MNAWLALLEWRQPGWLLLALQPWLMVLLLRLRRRRLLHYADVKLWPWALGGAPGGLGPGRFALTALAWLLLAAALAGPRTPMWIDEALAGQDPGRGGVQIIVVMDYSDGARAHPVVGPSGQQRAELEFHDLLGRLRGERLGLVGYSDQAGLLLPPTNDYRVLDFYLERAPLAFEARPARALGWALVLAVQTLQAEPGSAAAVVLLATAQSAGPELREAQAWLQAAGIPAYVLEIPAGSGVVVPAGRTALQQLARATGGRYAMAADSDADWRTLYDRGIALLPGEPESATAVRRWREHYPWLLVPGMVLLLLAHVPVRSRPLGRSPLLLSLGLLLAAAPLAADDARHRAAHQAFLAGQHPKALLDYSLLSGYQGRLGEGAAAYRLEDYEHAARQFVAALLQAGDAQERADALFNLGNALFRQERYAEAAEAYRGALDYRPGYDGARANLWEAQVKLQQQDRSRQGEAGHPHPAEIDRLWQEGVEELLAEEERGAPDDSRRSWGENPDERVARGEVLAEALADGEHGTAPNDRQGLERYGTRAAWKKLELLEDHSPAVLRALIDWEARTWSSRPPAE